MFASVSKVVRMEEVNESRLFEKMRCIFPGLPIEIIQHYVSQYARDEFTCIQLLNRIQDATNNAEHATDRVPNPNTELPIAEFENLNIQQAKMNMKMPPKQNGTRLQGQRSSHAGFPNISLPQANVSPYPQTAPMASGNFQGFFYVPYGSPIYSNNNGVLYSPIVQGTNNNLLLPMPMDSLIRSTSPNPEVTYARSNTPSPNSCTSSNSSIHNTVPTNIPPPIVPNWTLPTGGAFLLAPQVGPSYPAELTNNIPDHDTNPALMNMNKTNRSPRSEHSDIPNIDTQLHVNVEPNDNASHDWIPIQTMPSYVSSIPYRLVPSPNSQTQSSMNFYQADRLTPEPGLVQTPPLMTQSSIPFVPTQPVQYYFSIPPPGQVVVPNAKVEKHLNLQRQRFNSIRYELEKAKIKKSKLAEEMWEDEEIQSVIASQGDEIHQLKEHIHTLETECDKLCKEVDQHLKGKALLGEINDDFYTCLNTGQQGPLIPPRPSAELLRRITCTHGRGRRYSSDEDEENKDSWKCIKCTFANHPAISVCEMCTEPRSSQSIRS